MNGLIAPTPNTPFFDTNVPAIEQMTTVLNKYNPAITKSIYYDDTAVQNWSDGMIVLAAAKAANWTPSTQVTPAALSDALFTLHTTSDLLTHRTSVGSSNSDQDSRFGLSPGSPG